VTDEERQRTMDFILQQQAQFAAGMQRSEERMQRLEEADARASRRMDRFERVLVLMAQRFRRERRDMRERINALIEAQMRTEEAGLRMEEAVLSLTTATERNTKDIASLSEKGKGKDGDAGDGGASPS